MMYITGDTHGNYDSAKLLYFAKDNPNLTKDDFVIISGDFGGIWSEKTLELDLKFYQELPFTILFVDGNHENFDLIDAYKKEKWNGGFVHHIKPNIIHLMRGQVFNILGKTFFTMGGGFSVDKEGRIEGSSWWKQEMPSKAEMDEAIDNLKKVDNKVDFIITHSIDQSSLSSKTLFDSYKSQHVFIDNLLLQYFEDTIEYGHWYFGHYHIDGWVNDKKTAVFNNIIKVL